MIRVSGMSESGVRRMTRNVGKINSVWESMSMCGWIVSVRHACGEELDQARTAEMDEYPLRHDPRQGVC